MGEPQEKDVDARLVWVVAAGTGALIAAAAAAVALPSSFGGAYAGLSCLLFVVGTIALLWGFALGVSRSRTDDVSLSGLFFLSPPAAPPTVRTRFRAALAAEVVVVVVAAAVHPFTVLAFGVLAPMFALGLMATWGGRYAAFPPRPVKKAA